MDAGQPGLKEQLRLNREVFAVVDVVAAAVVSLPGRRTGNWCSKRTLEWTLDNLD